MAKRSRKAAPAKPPPRPGRPRAAASPPRRRVVWRLAGRLLLLLLIVFGIAPALLAIAYRFVPPPITVLMIQRLAEGNGLRKHWRPLSAISPNLPRAVIAAEDARFCTHHGFDFEAMRAAAAHNARSPNKVRGGSTVSQQTAKNVFLWPGRDYVRKSLEAYDTVLIEAIWGKRRILEVYLNVVEWGKGVYGAEAAAQAYFHHGAAALTPAEAARLAAILPSPLRWKAVNPGRYVVRRSRRIGAQAVIVQDDELAGCIE